MLSLETDDTAVRAVLETRAAAIRQKNVEEALAPCARDLVRFDLAPPLARSGGEALDPRHLAAWFDTWRGPLRYELRDVSITSASGIAFAHGFVRIGGTKQDGEAQDVWARLTVCLRKAGSGRSCTSTYRRPSTWTAASGPRSIWRRRRAVSRNTEAGHWREGA